MKKILLFTVLLLFLVSATFVSANGDLATTTPPIRIEASPGASASSSFLIDNTGTATIATINFRTSELVCSIVTCSGNTIPADFVTGSISSLTVAEEPRTIPIAITIPTKLTGDYVGILTAIDAANSTNVISISFTIHINSVDSLEIQTYSETTPLVITTREDVVKQTSISLRNLGSTALSGLTLVHAIDLTDSDDNTIVVTPSDPGTINPGETKTMSISINTPRGQQSDVYSGNISVSRGATSLDTFKLEIRVQPEDVVCSDGLVGDLNIRNVDFDEDDFKPGGTMTFDVDVKNEGNSDMDVIVEVYLYDVNEDEFLDNVEADSININDGDTETFENIQLVIPTSNIDENDDFVLYVKAYEDGDEESNCDEDSDDTINLQLESNEVIVQQFTLLPSTLSCGDQISASVDVLNIAKKDESDVYVVLRNTQLGLDKRSSVFDLDKFSDNNNDNSVKFNFDIPSDIDSGDYAIEAIVYYDDEDKTNSEIKTLTITECGTSSPSTPITTGDAGLEVLQNDFKVNNADSVSIPVTVTNTGRSTALFKVDVKGTGQWTDSDTKTIELDAGASKTLYFDLVAPGKAGTYSGTITVSSGNKVVGSDTVSVTTKDSTVAPITGATTATTKKSAFSNMPDSFWIIANIVLVIVGIFFVKMIFTRKKQ